MTDWRKGERIGGGHKDWLTGGKAKGLVAGVGLTGKREGKRVNVGRMDLLT